MAALPPTPAMDGLPPAYNDETLVAFPTAQPPVVDGVAEPLWGGAAAVEIIATGASGNYLSGSGIEVSAFHNYSWMFFLVTWPDASPDRMRDAWRLADNSTAGGNWTRTGWGEDAMSFFLDDGQGAERNFSATGCAALCHTGPSQMHTTGAGGTLDIWHWSAARSDPLGFADDRYLDDQTKQGGSATGGFHPDAADPYTENTVPTAYGDRPRYVNASAPTNSAHIAQGDALPLNWTSFDSGSMPNGTILPAWVLQPPAPGEGDVLAAASHNGSGWTLELARPFVTGDNGSRDLSVVDLGAMYYFSVAVTNNKTLENHSTPLLANQLIFAENVLPDYVVRSAAPLVTPVEQGAQADILTLVRNNGFSDGASPVTVAVVYAGNMTEVNRTTTAGLAWGGERSLVLSFDTAGLALGNHSLAVVADADDGTSESNETNNRYTFNLTVVPTTVLANVVLANVSGPAGPVFGGQNLTVTGTVENAGDADTVADVWVRASNASFASASVNVGPLAVGANAQFEINLSTVAVASGSYFVTVTADPDGLIDEGPSGEADNTAAVVATVEARPDLEPVQLTLFPAAAFAGDTTTLNVSVTNHGASFSGQVTVWTYLDNATSVGSNDRVLVWVGDLTLGRGEFGNLTTPFQVPAGLSPGAHSLRVWLDAPRAIAEINEANNNKSGALIVLEPPRPDLTVLGASIERASYSAGELAVVTASVRNVGANTTVAVLVEIRDPIANLTLWSTTIGPLASGATDQVTGSFTVSPGPAGTRTITVVVDPNDALAEASEFNNSVTATYTLLPPSTVDLRPGNLASSPASPTAGDTVRLTVDVTNDGNAASAETSGVFRIGTSPIGFVTVPALAPGAGTTLSIDWDTSSFTGLQALVTFVADPNGTVAEENESNNAVSTTVSFTRPGAPSLHLGLIQLAPPTVAPGETVRAEVGVRNNGTAGTAATVRFSVDGAVIAEVPVQLDPGSNLTVSANWTANASGTHFVRAEVVVASGVADATLASFDVSFVDSTPPADSTWLILLVVLVAAGVGLFLFTWARRVPSNRSGTPTKRQDEEE